MLGVVSQDTSDTSKEFRFGRSKSIFSSASDWSIFGWLSQSSVLPKALSIDVDDTRSLAMLGVVSQTASSIAFSAITPQSLVNVFATESSRAASASKFDAVFDQNSSSATLGDNDSREGAAPKLSSILLSNSALGLLVPNPSNPRDCNVPKSSPSLLLDSASRLITSNSSKDRS